MIENSLLLKNIKWQDALDQIVTLPYALQQEALKKFRKKFKLKVSEQWNTTFGKDSLYQAWTFIEPMIQLYNANREVIRDFIKNLKEWTIVEIGGGNGTLWQNFFSGHSKGEFILIDPVKDSHDTVIKHFPDTVSFTSIIQPVEQVIIPHADVIVCSLMLHHIPGFNTDHNKCLGINSVGKSEIIKRFLQSIRCRNGICIINESDIYTDIDLAPHDPVLIHRLIDSYIKRAGKSVAMKIDDPAVPITVRKKLELVMIHWLIDQVEIAGQSPLSKRDIYELDTIHWLELFQRVGANIINHGFTDKWHLFHQYIIK